MSWPLLALACAALALASWAATWAVLRGLVRFSVYDRPNPRSSHAQAKPRGGGLALVPLALLAWTAAAAWLGAAPSGFWPVLGGAAGLAVVSWFDDLKGLPVGLRLGVQALAVGIGLAAMAGSGEVFQGLLPPVLDRLVAALLWLWFVNLFNFMDGIDGLSGVETISLGLGLVLVGWLVGSPEASIALPALLAAATLGFLVWNWAPAKLFLGDVGSVPLGYLLGWLLLSAAMHGEWAAAAILPLYYLADATITLLKRAARGARVWRAHREHFYQRAVRGGASHGRVATQVLLCNAALVALSGVAASGYAWPALGGGALAVALLLAALERRAGAAARGT
jgi:UDP-N-acetylmuramyl pentapeptide phosphotransferase/UDP-N-acetylglucosamine-1-phosphate transferase